jgi:hypothetical protein
MLYYLLIQVEFAGENGSDSGGLSREFFTVIARDASRTFLEVTGVFRHNVAALKVW